MHVFFEEKIRRLRLFYQICPFYLTYLPGGCTYLPLSNHILKWGLWGISECFWIHPDSHLIKLANENMGEKITNGTLWMSVKQLGVLIKDRSRLIAWSINPRGDDDNVLVNLHFNIIKLKLVEYFGPLKSYSSLFFCLPVYMSPVLLLYIKCIRSNFVTVINHHMVMSTVDLQICTIDHNHNNDHNHSHILSYVMDLG